MTRRILGAVALYLSSRCWASPPLWRTLKYLRILLEQTGLSEQTLLLLSAINNAVLVGIAVLIGAVTAHRVSLKSLIAHPASDKSRLLGAFSYYALLGVLLGAAVAFADHWAFANIANLKALADSTGGEIAGPEPTLAVRFLYGGITEEVLLRWGMLQSFCVGYMGADKKQSLGAVDRDPACSFFVRCGAFARCLRRP